MKILLGPDNAKSRMVQAWDEARFLLSQGKRVRVTVDELAPSRTVEQNAKLWAMLHDIAKQVKWPVDGLMQYMSEDDWKDILSAGLKKNQRVAQGVEGGFVILGVRTSKMKVGEMAELIEFIQYFGDENGVVWTKDDLQS